MDIVSRALLVAGGASEPTDPLRNQVTLLLKPDSSANSTNNTITDSSTNNFTVTRNGNVTPGSFSPFGDRWSNYFGSGNYISAASNAAFSPGTGDFTVEAWVFPDSAYTTFNYVLGVAVANGLVFYVTGGNLVVRSFNGSDLLASATIPALNTWTHVAATRSGTTLRIFVNGVQTATTTNSTNFAQGAAFVGNDSTNAAPWYGYISNFRFVKGTALYTSNFTPSTTPLTAVAGTSLLTCQSNRFVDNSSNAFAITVTGSPSVQRFSPFSPTDAYGPTPWTGQLGGSAYFDGTGDFLTVADNAAFEMTGDFTVEAWFYGTSTFNGLQTVLSKGVSGTFQPYYFYISNGNLFFYASNTGSTWSVGVDMGTVRVRQWNHIAVSKQGTGLRLFLNGQLVNTTTNSGAMFDNTSVVGIGCRSDGTELFIGYIAGVRFVKGTAVYTATFTPSIEAPTAITNTSLLLNFTSAGVVDHAMLSNLETVGNVQISAAQSRFGGASLAFDGSGDYLTAPNSLAFRVGSGDFTIECWVYFSGLSNSQSLVSLFNTNGVNPGYTIYKNATTHKMEFYAANGTPRLVSGSAVTTGQWYHIAVVRNGSALVMYINGVSEASTTNTSFADETVNALYIGARADDIAATSVNGFIDDLRITKAARYTANFTPPTATFPSF